MKFFLPLICFTILVVSCGKSVEKHEFVTIVVDVKSTNPIETSAEGAIRVVELDSSKQALLKDINNLFFVNDTIVVFSSNRIATYDLEGRYLRDISNEGKANNEFIKLDDVTVEKDKICTFDHLKQVQNCFDVRGNYLNTESVILTQDDIYKPLFFREIEDDKLVGLTSFVGTESNPKFLFFDGNYKKTGESKDLMKHNFRFSTNQFYPTKDGLLYWEMFNDTVYTINSNFDVSPKYSVDFEDYRLPKEILEGYDIMKIFQYLNDNPSKVAILVNLIEHNDNLFIIYSYDSKMYLCKYNKNSKEIVNYDLSSMGEKLKISPVLSLYNDCIVIPALVEDDNLGSNYVLYHINADML